MTSFPKIDLNQATKDELVEEHRKACVYIDWCEDQQDCAMNGPQRIYWRNKKRETQDYRDEYSQSHNSK